MSRVEAALADLELLVTRLRWLDEDLRPCSEPLAAAIERAWATNPGLLGPTSTLDGEFDGIRRRGRDLVVEVDDARQRLAAAGGSDLSWTGGGSATLRHLAAAAAAPAGGPMSELLWRLLATALFGRAPRRATVPYVVSSSTETLAVSGPVDTSITYLREELSDGTVRITELLESASTLIGAGIGARCTLGVDGHTLVDHGLLLSATISAVGAAGRTWVFAGRRAADRWWQDRRTSLRTSALLRALPFGGGALTALHRWVTGDDVGRSPDETFEEVSLEAAAQASSSDPLTSSTVRALAGGTIRHGGDGTITVSSRLGVDAAHTVGLPPFRSSPEPGIRIDATVELALRDGELVGVTLRSVGIDRAGIDAGAGRPPGLVPAAGGEDELSVYETTVDLDLTDESVRRLVEAALPLDGSRAGAAVLAGLGALLADERLVHAAAVTVLERALPNDQRWQVSCSWDLPGKSGSFGATTGHTGQQTLGVWQKAPGETTLHRVG